MQLCDLNKIWFIRHIFVLFNVKIYLVFNKIYKLNKRAKISKMVAVQNIRFLLWNFIEQRRNYNARKRRILTSIGVILKRRKGKIQKILDLLRLESFLLEHHGIQKNRQRTCRRFYRNNTIFFIYFIYFIYFNLFNVDKCYLTIT